MKTYTYLVVGGGMAADAAIRGIRELDNQGSIGLISEEFDAPYARPPLSKGLWKGASADDIWLHTEEQRVDLHLARRAVSIDTSQHIVIDNQDEPYKYTHLLLATGGSPRKLQYSGSSVTYYRTYEDFKHVMNLAKEGKSFAVIGGGFIGSEIAAALAMNGNRVAMFFPEAGLAARVFPADASKYLAGYYSEKGVTVYAGTSVSSVKDDDGGVVVATDNAGQHRVDHVIVGIGIKPRTELAEASGLTVGNGIEVNEYLQTSNADVFAAGDVASVFNKSLDKRLRAEHEDSALRMGRAAGRAMTGERLAYDHLPAFYSDLFDLGYEAVGDVSAEHDVVAIWQEKYKEGVLYYCSGQRVVGVLLWNVWDKVDAARELITSRRTLSREQLLTEHPLKP